MRHVISRLRSTSINKCVSLLNRRDKQKFITLILAQVVIAFLDLLGVALIGILGSIAVAGLGAGQIGDRVQIVLGFLGLESMTLQSQAAILGISAAVILISRTLLTVYLARKTMFFLARKSAWLASSLISKLLNSNLLFIQKKTVHTLIVAITDGSNIVTLGILGTSAILVSDLALLVILATGLFIVDFKIALGTFGIFIVVAIVLYKIMYVRAHALGFISANLGIESKKEIAEVLISYREAFVRDRTYHYAQRISETRDSLAKVSAEMQFMPSISKYVIEITLVVTSVVISAVQFFTLDASRAVATMSVFIAAGTRIAPAILRVQQGLITIKGNIGLGSPTLELLDELNEVKPVPKPIGDVKFTYTDFISEVRLEKVSFTYPDSTLPVLEDITLVINQGQRVAIVGASGAGKSTLVDLLLGVKSPTQGSVRISNVDPQTAIMRWPGAMAYVPQDIVITDGSIAENVTLGFPASLLSKDRVLLSLDLADLGPFVRELPGGINTYLGERGARISGGQRQRIGIARALYTDPRLLVLDEATSSLDGESESNIANSIMSLPQNVTVVLIAHRLSSIKSADLVVFLNNGRIEAQGSFDQVRSLVPNFDNQARLMGL
jgi:ABC-type multidrug transport system fused ATPase/permease subunit